MRRFIVPLIALAVVGVIVGIIQWNKPHRRAEHGKAIAVTAQALYGSYNADEQSANRRYLNKLVEVKGELQSREQNQDGQTVAILRGEGGNDLLAGGIMCTLRDKDAKLPTALRVTLKGFCTGFANDVHLTDCIVSNP